MWMLRALSLAILIWTLDLDLVILGCVVDESEPVLSAARLVGGPSPLEGRLEIHLTGGNVDSSWGTVCSREFDDADASVFCRFMALSDAGESMGHRYGQNASLEISGSKMECRGDEDLAGSCDTCSHGIWRKNTCQHSQDVSMKCYPANRTKVRLVGGGHAAQGRVEVYHDSQWGTICNDQFDDSDAAVICRMLGNTDNPRVLRGKVLAGQGPIWLDHVDCKGDEGKIDECVHKGWGRHRCSHREDVLISCSDSPGVRLVGGMSEREGRLEVRHAGQWGTVCDDDFDNNAASVFCRMLGLGDVGLFRESEFGPGRGTIWLDNVYCSGTERRLEECVHRGFGFHDCHHREDVSIGCGTPIIRIVEGNTPREGRLEIQHFGRWGTVCDDLFDDRAASVCCRMLGLGDVGRKIGSHFWAGRNTIWLDDVSCDGDEASILDCHHLPWGTNNCDHFEDVAIRCE